MLSNNVISGADYLAIATYYANARLANVGSVDYLYDAVYKIVLSDNVYPTIDLINEFWTSYQINTDIYRSPTTYLSAVRAINNHVINRSGSAVTDLNDYLIEASVEIPMAWAELCKITGVLVCQGNISNLPSATYSAIDGLTVPRFADGTAIPAC
jgi:hypothetical protein